MDNRIYLYNILQLEKGPIKFVSACQIGSFYVKSTISPDAAHILGGSSDGNACIWQVNRPHLDPVMLKSHDGEVTAVDWCPSETGKMTTSSDDFTSSYCSSTRYPSLIQRRVMVMPSVECREFFINEERTGLAKDHESSNSDDEVLHQINSSSPIPMPVVNTPEAQKRKFSSNFDLKETFEKSPEAALKSPSSVLNPPFSVKRRTIRDYFLVAQ